MLNATAPMVQVSAEFVNTLSSTVEMGKEYYSAFSPYYTSYSFIKYANEIIYSPAANLTAMGNFALTALSMPSVQENIAKSVEATLGIDHESMQPYIYGAITCLNVAATILPLVSSYLSTPENIGNVDKIKDAVDKIEKSIKPAKVASKEHVVTKSESQKRKAVLTQYPAIKSNNNPKSHQRKRKQRRHKTKK